MSGQRELNVLRGAGIQDMKQDALALLHAHRLAMAQALAVDGETLISDLPSVGRFVLPLRRRRTRLLLFFLRGRVEGFPFMRG